MTTRVVNTSMRHDEKIQELSANGLLLFFCLIDHILGHMSGIFCIPKAAMSWGKLNLEETDLALQELIACELVEWDEKNEVAWLRNGAYYQCHEGHWGARHIDSIERQVKSLQYSSLSGRFIDYYSKKYNLQLNGIVNRMRKGSSGGLPNPPDTDTDTDTDKFHSPLSEDAKQIDINGVLPAKKAAKETKRKGVKKARPKGDGKDDGEDFITRILQTCSEARYNSKNRAVGHTTVNPHDPRDRKRAYAVHAHILEQNRLSKRAMDTDGELKYIGRLYGNHFLAYEKRNLDAKDFIVDSNYCFAAFQTHLDEWIEAENRDERRMAPDDDHEEGRAPRKPQDPATARDREKAAKEMIDGVVAMFGTELKK